MLVCVCVVVSLSLAFSLILASRAHASAWCPGMGYPNTSSAVVRPYQPDRGHGLTSCAPNHAPNPRVELSLTRTAAHPYQMSESEMGLTLPDSSLLTRGAGHPYPLPGLEMSPTRVVGKPPFKNRKSGGNDAFVIKGAKITFCRKSRTTGAHTQT